VCDSLKGKNGPSGAPGSQPAKKRRAEAGALRRGGGESTPAAWPAWSALLDEEDWEAK
jgi:hypothetical protein